MGKGHCKIIIFIYCPRKYKISGAIRILLLLAAQQNYQCGHCAVSRAWVLSTGMATVLQPGPGSEKLWMLPQLQQPLWTLFNSVMYFSFFFPPNFEANSTLAVHTQACEFLTEDKVLDIQQVQGAEPSSERLNHFIIGHILANISWKVAEQNS